MSNKEMCDNSVKAISFMRWNVPCYPSSKCHHRLIALDASIGLLISPHFISLCSLSHKCFERSSIFCLVPFFSSLYFTFIFFSYFKLLYWLILCDIKVLVTIPMTYFSFLLIVLIHSLSFYSHLLLLLSPGLNFLHPLYFNFLVIQDLTTNKVKSAGMKVRDS